jgi:hypothetical protein
MKDIFENLYKVMKKNISLFLNINIVSIISIVVGFIMIYFAYRIPLQNIEKHVYESATIFEKEGAKPTLYYNINSALDNFTDALMLLNSITSPSASTLENSLLVYRYHKASLMPNNVLIKISNGDEIEDVISYPRYWHGYLIVIKPLLYFFNYSQIRIINTIFQIFIIIFVILLILIKKYYKFIVPYILLILSLIPPVIFKSMQYSSVWYIFNFGIIIIILLRKKLVKKFNYVCCLFALLGVLTSYFDFLTYPIVTFGIPAIFYFSIYKNDKSKKIFELFWIGFSWVYGYLVMWSSKWFIATEFTNENVIENALNAASDRTSNVSDNLIAFSRLDSLQKNLELFFNKYIIFSLILVGIILMILILKNKKIKAIKYQFPIAIIGCLPLIWYIVLGNHSYIHCWMTNKGLCVSYFSILMILFNTLLFENSGDDKKRSKIK